MPQSGTKPLEKLYKTCIIFNLNVGKQRVKTYTLNGGGGAWNFTKKKKDLQKVVLFFNNVLKTFVPDFFLGGGDHWDALQGKNGLSQ